MKPSIPQDQPNQARRLATMTGHRTIRVRRRAFTLLEISVSIGLLLIAMVTVAGILHLSSEAAGRTAAHARVLEASTALQHELTDKLNRIVPGLLIIESPPPTLARADVREGPKYYRLRRDRLVFIASYAGEGAFESFTDPTRGTPANPNFAPSSSSDALMYFGPGIPVIGDGSPAGSRRDIEYGSDDPTLAASEWMFLHRAVLFLQTDPPAPGWFPPDVSIFTSVGGMLDGGDLSSSAALLPFFDNRMDAVVPDPSGISPNGSALIAYINNRVAFPGAFAGLFHGASPPAAALWQPSLAPVTVSYSDPANVDYFNRSGSNFSTRLADFSIEWTDGGRVDPLGPDNTPASGDEDFRTRWFGLAPDVTDTPDLASPDSLQFQARLRGASTVNNPSNPNPANPDNEPFATSAFQNRIEWSPIGVTTDTDARYRAVWIGNDYELFRPKALRFTYRIFDANNRLSDETTLDLNDDGIPDPDASSTPFLVRRWGLEFSIVVPLP